MHDPGRVSLVQRSGRLPEVLDDKRGSDWAILLEDAFEIAAAQELHDVERRAIQIGRGVCIGDPRDVLARDPRGCACFTPEALHQRSVSKDLRMEHLESEALVGMDVVYEVDGAHTTVTDLARDAIASGDDGPGLER